MGIQLFLYGWVPRPPLHSLEQYAPPTPSFLSHQVFIGRLGTVPLAAASLAITYSNISYYILLGASSALDTLGAQAFGEKPAMAFI